MSERLRSARRGNFVGRTEELRLFRSVLAAERPPFTVLFVHGPGGVGKSALLRVLADEAGDRAHLVDLRVSLASPPAFTEAVALAPEERRPVILIDTYEAGAGIDEWLRERFIPGLPEGALVVIAGRNPPGPGWSRDPAWRELLRVLPLRNLRAEEARAYLHAARIPAEQAEPALRSTHGHPLALALLADLARQSPDRPLPELRDAPDVVRALQERFVSDVPTELHRRALEACAHARVTTEDLLCAALELDDAHELFGWLATLSFIDHSAGGLYPHDLVRDVLDAELRWRAPGEHARLRERVRRHAIERARAGEGDPRTAAADLVFLHRSNPFTATQWDWASFGSAYGDALRPGDGEALLTMTERHEGAECARWVAHWLERCPEAFVVVREASEHPRGFLLRLPLHALDPADIAADPGARAMWEYAQAQAPRPGDEVMAARTLIDAEHYQAPSPTLNVVTIVDTTDWLTRPRLALELIGVWADADAAAPLMEYIDFQRVPEAGYEIGEREFAVFAHDWRRVDAEAWLELAAARELADGISPAAPVAEPVVALAREEFDDAVRDALRRLHDDAGLARNPLLRSRLVRERAGEGDAANALRELIEEAANALRANPRAEHLERVLARTYLRPARTQELAAESLDLALSTYRRHLRRGEQRVSEWLWHRELYGERD
ncbi:MAG TPA: AAA family ATPase [Solirubrobacterales bacterium]